MVQNENPTRCRDWKFEKVVWHILHIKVIFDKSIYGIICVNVRKELNIWKCCLLPGQMKKCLEWVAKSQFSTNFQHAAVAIRNISKLYNLTKDTAIELVFLKRIFISLLSQKTVENGNIWTALKGDKNVLFCKKKKKKKMTKFHLTFITSWKRQSKEDAVRCNIWNTFEEEKFKCFLKKNWIL